MNTSDFLDSMETVYREVCKIIDAFENFEPDTRNSSEEFRSTFYSLMLGEDDFYRIRSKVDWLRRPIESTWVVESCSDDSIQLQGTKFELKPSHPIDVYIEERGGYWLCTGIRAGKNGYYFSSLGEDTPIIGRRIRFRPRY